MAAGITFISAVAVVAEWQDWWSSPILWVVFAFACVTAVYAAFAP